MTNKFLIQTVDGKIVHDFCFGLIGSIDVQNWFHGKEIWTYELSDTPNHKIDAVPIGSIEFTRLSCLYKEKILNPIDIPKALIPYAKREILYGDSGLARKRIKEWGRAFVKNHISIKEFADILDNPNQVPKDATVDAPEAESIEYMISEVVDIKSEWRVFVFRGSMVGLKNYSGDFTIFPNIETINMMIKSFINAPMAYTLDVGIVGNNTVIIEVHHFFSVGLYGFDDKCLPLMFKAWYNQKYIPRKIW